MNDEEYLQSLGFAAKTSPEKVRKVVAIYDSPEGSQYQVYGKERIVAKATAGKLWHLWKDGKLARFSSQGGRNGTPPLHDALERQRIAHYLAEERRRNPSQDIDPLTVAARMATEIALVIDVIHHGAHEAH